MALDWNYVIKEGHKVSKPFIVQGLEKGLTRIDEIVAESGTIVDDLLWADAKFAVREHKDLNPTLTEQQRQKGLKR